MGSGSLDDIHVAYLTTNISLQKNKPMLLMFHS